MTSFETVLEFKEEEQIIKRKFMKGRSRETSLNLPYLQIEAH
jgi:hypothetical protein